MDVGIMARLKKLEDENCRLRKMYAEKCLKAEKWLRKHSAKKLSSPSQGKEMAQRAVVNSGRTIGVVYKAFAMSETDYYR